MNKINLLPILGAIAIPTILALRAPDDSISFAPDSETAISMEFNNTLEFFLDDFSAEAMGNDVGDAVGDIEMSGNVNIEVAFTDTYTSVADGMPRSFAREFNDANITGEGSVTAQGESESQAFELESALSDVTVEFKWNDEEEQYDAAYPEDEEGDEDLLDDLIARADLAFMLPAGEVSVDDEWDIDAFELATLLVPSGDLGYDTEDGDRADIDGEEGGIDDNALEMMRSLMEGEVKGKYKGVNDEGLAEIAITLEIAGDKDFADLIAEGIRKAMDASGGEIPEDFMPEIETFAVELSLDGEGTLLWDVRAGHVASFVMSAETEIAVTLEMSMPQPGMTIPISADIILGGSAEISIEASDA